jgi:hypothetical protein
MDYLYVTTATQWRFWREPQGLILLDSARKIVWKVWGQALSSRRTLESRPRQMSEHSDPLNVPQRSYIELISINIFQINSGGVLAWIVVVDVAYSMGSQVDVSILIIWDLVLSVLGAVSFMFSDSVLPVQSRLGRLVYPS